MAKETVAYDFTRLLGELRVARCEISNLRQQIRSLKYSQEKQIEELHYKILNWKCLNCRMNDKSTCNILQEDVNEKRSIVLEPIGYISTEFSMKKGVPRQPSLCPQMLGKLTILKSVFTNPEHALEGLNEYSHMWILFHFNRNESRHALAKVSPPRLNGDKTGVFATRSPHRPSPIGLSLVRIDCIQGSTVFFSGVDMLDKTPVLDIKPYIPQYDDPSEQEFESNADLLGVKSMPMPPGSPGIYPGNREDPDGEESDEEQVMKTFVHPSPQKIMVSKPNRSNKKQRDLSEKVKAIDSELMSFYEFCEKMGFTQEEMDTICSPLKEVISKHSMTRLAKGLAAVVIIFGAIYCATHIGPLSTHTTAVGRIAMIKVLSFWDWQHLFHEQCLIENPLYGEYGLTHEDCMTCEALDTIKIISRTSYKVLSDNYFNRDAPVIISDATDSWLVMNTGLHFDNVTQLYFDDEKLTDSVPCVLTTNLRLSSSDLMSFLKLISNSSIKKWFVHWQNCDIHAVKALRKFYQKPYFLPNTISPAHFNWVFMSSDYNSRNYKKMELDFGLIMLIQLRGNTSVRLLPYKPCNDSCSDLSATLNQGEILVLKNYLWNLEYLPGHGVDNIAILTETAWDPRSV